MLSQKRFYSFIIYIKVSFVNMTNILKQGRKILCVNRETHSHGDRMSWFGSWQNKWKNI